MEAMSIKEIAEAVGGRILWGREDIPITSVSTNSRNMEPGSLFIPIVGERVDAHDYIKDAVGNGAIACFTSRHKTREQIEKFMESTNNPTVYLGVEDTLKALQALGTYYRSKFHIPVIGITGSVGKTTTKEMVAAALETKYTVLKTEGNMNSQVGLPLMMLRLNFAHQIAVIEMGMSEAGEMERLTRIAKPEGAVMTNIGVSHIAQLKTKENIRKEKLNIINAFGESSVLYINGDDSLLYEVVETSEKLKLGEPISMDVSEASGDRLSNCHVISFGAGENCTYRAEDIRVINGETHFQFVTENESPEEIILLVLGEHNVNNALAALAVAKQYRIPPAVAKEGLRNYRPIAMRGQIKEAGGIRIIDDSYNASPDSMKSGIQVLLQLEGVKRRIAVLADVLELGELSRQCHYEVGLFIAGQKIDEVVTVGTEAAYIASAIKEQDAPVKTHSFDSNREAAGYLKANLRAGDGVLIKGSRFMKTDEIIEELLRSFAELQKQLSGGKYAGGTEQQ